LRSISCALCEVFFRRRGRGATVRSSGQQQPVSRAASRAASTMGQYCVNMPLRANVPSG
jgi:hypothetical protein